MVQFREHIPSWGGTSNFNYEDEGERFKISNKRFRFVNTCTVDYYLLAMWSASKLSPIINEYLLNNSKSQVICKLIKLIDDKQWNKAKTLWFFEILGIENLNIKPRSTVCSFGSEYQFFSKYVQFLQEFSMIEICDKCNYDCSPRVKQNHLILREHFNKLVLNIQTKSLCPSCGFEVNRKVNFVNGEPCWLICEIDAELRVSVSSLPRKLSLNRREYKLLCATYNSNAHFIGIFLLNNKFYIVNDLNPQNIQEGCPKRKLTNCFYYSSK